jgi:hypothetical protein
MGFSIDLITQIAEELEFRFNFSLVPSNRHDDMVNELVTRVRPQLPSRCHCVHLTAITSWNALLVSFCRGQTWPFVTWP